MRAIIAGLLVLLAASRAEAAGGPLPGAVNAQTLKLPDGPGSVRGLSDSPQVNVFSAQVSYDIPFELPEGPGGFAPALGLSYSGELGNSPVGLGWWLSSASIRRSLRLGVPTYGASDELELAGIAGGGRLVALPDGTWRVEGRGHAVKVVREGTGFVVTTSGGVRYRLGFNATARQEDGTRTAAWFVEEVQHPTGQTVVLSYGKDQGQVYLTKVAWGPSGAFAADLVYVTRSDRSTSWRTGFSVVTARRLSEVRVSSFGELLRVYQLFYDNTFAISRLARVKQLGRGRVGALPELTLSYAAAEAVTVEQVGAAGGWVLNQAGVSFMDVDGDGMNDLVRLDREAQSWRKGLGNGFGPEQPMTGAAGAVLANVRLVDTDGDVRPELVMGSLEGWPLLRLQGGAWQEVGRWGGTEGLALMDSSLFFGDLNGDLLVDMIRTGAETLSVRWNTGTGLGPWQTKPAVDGVRLMPGPNVRLHEVNGDGLADVVALSGSSMSVFLGKGDGTFAASVTYAYPWTDTVLDLGTLRLGDLNRDGIMDVVRLSGANLSWYAGLAQGGFKSTAREVARPGVDGATVVVTLVDANGNGSEDVVWSAPDGMWVLDMAGATSAGMLTGLTNGMGKEVELKYEGSAKLAVAAEVAGNAWEKWLPMSIPVPVGMEVEPGAGSPTRKVEYTVRDGFWDAKERRFGGFLVGGVRTLGATPADTLYEQTRFHPGLDAQRILRGSPLEVRTQDGTGTLFTVATSVYEARPVEGLPDVPLLRKAALVEQRTKNHEGVTTPLETLTTYAYDARVRSIEETHLGRLDLTGDEKTVKRAYASDDTQWVQDVVCEEKVQEADGTLVSHTRNFYGDATQVYAWTDVANCRASRLMRETHGWLADATTPRWVLQKATEYDAWDNPTRLYENGSWRSLTYDSNHLRVTAETHSPQAGRTLTWTMTWDNVLGQPRTLTDANGVVSEMSYDSLGRPESLAVAGAPPHQRHAYDWTAPMPRTLTYVYDGTDAELRAEPTPWTPGPKWRQSVAVANGLGEALFSATRVATSRWIISDWQERDARGKVAFVAEDFYWDGDVLPSTRPASTPGQTLAYDALGRLLRQTLPTGGTKTLTYKAFESVQAASELAPVTTRLDGLGRILRTERQVGTTLESVAAAYDAADRIRSLRLQDGAVTHGFTYDTLGRMVAAHDPDIGHRTLRYDDGGRLTHHTNGASQTRQYFYDDAGRLIRTVGEDGAAFVYHYDVAKDGSTAGNLASRLAWVEEPLGEVHYAYDAQGRIVRQRRAIDGSWADEATVYSPSGLLLATEADGVRIDHGYDAAGRPVRAGSYWEALALDASGQVLEERYGNGLRQVFARNDLGMVMRVQVLRPSGAALYDVTLTRNAYGAPRTVRDDDGVGLNHSATFTYDTAARLTDAILGAVQLPDGTLGEGTGSYRFGYHYDGLQNLVQRQAVGPKALDLLQGTYHYGERGFGPRQLTRVASGSGDTLLDYDTAGRVVRRGERTMQYNGLDQLVRVTMPGAGGTPTTVEHAYGHEGLRTFTRGPTGDTQYWFSSQLSQRGSVKERYVRVKDRTLARVTQPAATAALPAGVMGQAAGLQAGLFQAVANGFTGLLVGALFLLSLSAVLARSSSHGRGRRMGAGLLAVCVLALSCGQGLESAEEAARYEAEALALSEGTLYFHEGVAAGPGVMTRADGTVFEERRYEPFGAPVDAFRELPGGGTQVGDVDHGAEPLNALNKNTDAHTGWSDHGVRWMAPETGLWLTPDPPVKGPDPKFLSSPWDLHPYQYVRQNPLLYWDPDGRDPLRLRTNDAKRLDDFVNQQVAKKSPIAGELKGMMDDAKAGKIELRVYFVDTTSPNATAADLNLAKAVELNKYGGANTKPIWNDRNTELIGAMVVIDMKLVQSQSNMSSLKSRTGLTELTDEQALLHEFGHVNGMIRNRDFVLPGKRARADAGDQVEKDDIRNITKRNNNEAHRWENTARPADKQRTVE